MYNKGFFWMPYQCVLLLAILALALAPAVCLAGAGDLDLTFGDGGKVTTDFGSIYDRASSVAIQADGKIVVAGGHYDFALARYNSDGTLDTGFGTDGKVTTDFGSYYDRAYSVAIQADGKIVVAGYAQSGSPTFNDFALARYNSDGTLDTGFGTDGKVTTDFASSHDNGFKIAILANGKIIVAGAARIGSYYHQALARYNPDGTLDTAFGGDGKVTTDFGPYWETFRAMALQADGKIVVAGSIDTGWAYDFAIARYKPDGTLDNSFGSGGLVITEVHWFLDDRAKAVAIQADGKIVVAGSSSYYGGGDFVLARYNPRGTLDIDFGSDGLVTTDFASGSDDYANAVAIQADGKIVVAGLTQGGGPTGWDFALARYEGISTPPQELLAWLVAETQQLVSSGDLNNGNGNALQSKLQAAIQQLDRDNMGAAFNQMQAFINQVDAFISAGVLSPEEGQPLIDAAQEAIGGLAKRAGELASEEGTPSQYQLFQNYPNPFNPRTTIEYSLPEAERVTISVYDLLGRRVAVLIDEHKQAGHHSVNWDAATVASGTYFYRIQAAENLETRKMVLLK